MKSSDDLPQIVTGQFWQKKDSLFTVAIVNCTDSFVNVQVVRSMNGNRPRGTTLSTLKKEVLLRDYLFISGDEDTSQ